MKERVYIYRVDTKKIIFRGHSKSTLARNFQFLTPLPPCSFYMYPRPLPSTYVCFSELPPFQNKSRDVYDAYFE